MPNPLLASGAIFCLRMNWQCMKQHPCDLWSMLCACIFAGTQAFKCLGNSACRSILSVDGTLYSHSRKHVVCWRVNGVDINWMEYEMSSSKWDSVYSIREPEQKQIFSIATNVHQPFATYINHGALGSHCAVGAFFESRWKNMIRSYKKSEKNVFFTSFSGRRGVTQLR